MASPEQAGSAAGSPYDTSVPEKMDFDLFEPSPGLPVGLRQQHRASEWEVFQWSTCSASVSSTLGVSRPFCCKCGKWFRSNCTGATGSPSRLQHLQVYLQVLRERELRIGTLPSRRLYVQRLASFPWSDTALLQTSFS